MGKRLTLILGGARSGKSDFAQALARQRGGDHVLFVATAQALDDEMRERIRNHQASRPATWQTLEAPWDVARHLGSVLAHVVVVDCMTLWTSNILLNHESDAMPVMRRELDELLTWYRTADCELIVVSNEVGMGIVPADALSRAYRDLLGVVNKRLAAAADQVFWMVAGLPIDAKSLVAQWENL